MIESVRLPDNIRQDVSIYLGPEEKILKALSSMSGKTEAIGEIWLILTSHSVFFHTREFNKEPVIALLARGEIKEIDYFQKPSEIVLTFFPRKNQANSTRLSFPIEKRNELEDFCDEIADLINFRMETSAGVKVYPKPADTPQPEKKSEKNSSVKSEVSSPRIVIKPEAAKEASSNIAEKEMPTERFTKPKAPEVKIVSSATNTSKDQLKSDGPGARYIVIATIVSIVVAFIWYQFFKAISSRSGR